jgi:hypothetical protein
MVCGRRRHFARPTYKGLQVIPRYAVYLARRDSLKIPFGIAPNGTCRRTCRQTRGSAASSVFLRNPPRSAKLMRDRVAQSLNAQPGVLGDAGVPPHRPARG